MIRQMILEMEEAVNKATASVGTAVASEKRLERQVLAQEDQMESWQKKAELAVESGEDELGPSSAGPESRTAGSPRRPASRS